MHPEDAVTAHGHICLEDIRQKTNAGKEQIKDLYQHSRKYKKFLHE
jgi:hypothetical protein